MQIELREKKVKIQCTFIEIPKLKIETQLMEQINVILFLSRIKHDSRYKIRNTINELEFLIDVAWSIGHGLYFCFKYQLKCSTLFIV